MEGGIRDDRLHLLAGSLNYCWGFISLAIFLVHQQHLVLIRGQVGTIVEIYEPDVFEVEFIDSIECNSILTLSPDRQKNPLG